jgi:hypothetical protein
MGHGNGDPGGSDTLTADQPIREISRAEYDKMVKGQQAFFDALIKEGRARIVEGEAQPAKPAISTPAPAPGGTRRPLPKDPIRQLAGQTVTARLIDGSTISGMLEQVWQFDIVIDGVVVLKHALLTIKASDGA